MKKYFIQLVFFTSLIELLIILFFNFFNFTQVILIKNLFNYHDIEKPLYGKTDEFDRFTPKRFIVIQMN